MGDTGYINSIHGLGGSSENTNWFDEGGVGFDWGSAATQLVNDGRSANVLAPSIRRAGAAMGPTLQGLDGFEASVQLLNDVRSDLEQGRSPDKSILRNTLSYTLSAGISSMGLIGAAAVLSGGATLVSVGAAGLILGGAALASYGIYKFTPALVDQIESTSLRAGRALKNYFNGDGRG